MVSKKDLTQLSRKVNVYLKVNVVQNHSQSLEGTAEDGARTCAVPEISMTLWDTYSKDIVVIRDVVSMVTMFE